MPEKKDSSYCIYTVGHSTRTLDAFLELLQAHEVKLLVDVRTIPRSRKNSQFNKETFPLALKQVDIDYLHMPELGGLRKPRVHSSNTGWRNASFRGYADYMQTEDCEKYLQTLMELGKNQQVAIMCAEAVPWRCHRSLIGDALQVRNIPVEDILTKTRRQSHRFTSFAKVNGTHITYPADEEAEVHETENH
jgi:uncharacterized protein (DUF488 family)